MIFQPTMNLVQTTLNSSDNKGYLAEFRMKTADGSWKYIMGRGNISERDSDGKPRILSGTNTDISERKKSEEMLKKSEMRYRSLFTEMLEGLAFHEIICDSQGKPVDYRFLSINPAFEKLTGLSADYAVGKTVREVIPGVESFWIERYGKVALTGEPVSFENYIQGLDQYYKVAAYCPEHGKFAVLIREYYRT